ncbi:hypothetical protein RFI_15494, partial [Reticulomyxa filosa]
MKAKQHVQKKSQNSKSQQTAQGHTANVPNKPGTPFPNGDYYEQMYGPSLLQSIEKMTNYKNGNYARDIGSHTTAREYSYFPAAIGETASDNSSQFMAVPKNYPAVMAHDTNGNTLNTSKNNMNYRNDMSHLDYVSDNNQNSSGNYNDLNHFGALGNPKTATEPLQVPKMQNDNSHTLSMISQEEKTIEERVHDIDNETYMDERFSLQNKPFANYHHHI